MTSPVRGKILNKSADSLAAKWASNGMKAADVSLALLKLGTPEKAKASAWFFKTGPGQYGHGDKFLGVSVPEQRKIARQFKDLPLSEAEKLIISPWHEERLTGLFILVSQYKNGDEVAQRDIYNFYIGHTKNINNWDLVDSSASYIVGPWLENKPQKMKTLEKLAKSDLLWDRRIAMISTLYYISCGSSKEALKIAEILLNDKHNLIQKAVGWTLREVGKRVSRQDLTSFLAQHADSMPRTALRYSIEHFKPEQRSYYSKLAKAKS